MKELAGRTAVVTGAASGIGRAMALRFAAEGMRVVAADVEEPPLGETIDLITGNGGEAIAVPCDVSSWTAVQALRDATTSAFGPAAVLCNNAGVAPRGSVVDAPLASWEWCLGVNLWGVIHGCRAFVPAMIEQGFGHVVNTASVLGLITSAGVAPYTVSKHAVVALSEMLHAELADANTGVGVTCLCPGFVATNIIDSERNRPERYHDPNTPELFDSVTREAVRELYSQSMAPENVAAQVVEAIVAEQFYLLTDHDFDPEISQRHRKITDRGAPANNTAALLDKLLK